MAMTMNTHGVVKRMDVFKHQQVRFLVILNFKSIQLYQPEKNEKTLLKHVLRQGFLFLFVVSMTLYGNMTEYLANRFFDDQICRAVHVG